MTDQVKVTERDKTTEVATLFRLAIALIDGGICVNDFPVYFKTQFPLIQLDYFRRQFIARCVLMFLIWEINQKIEN